MISKQNLKDVLQGVTSNIMTRVSDARDNLKYSSEEIKTNSTWIDTKPIYRRVTDETLIPYDKVEHEVVCLNMTSNLGPSPYSAHGSSMGPEKTDQFWNAFTESGRWTAAEGKYTYQYVGFGTTTPVLYSGIVITPYEDETGEYPGYPKHFQVRGWNDSSATDDSDIIFETLEAPYPTSADPITFMFKRAKEYKHYTIYVYDCYNKGEVKKPINLNVKFVTGYSPIDEIISVHETSSHKYVNEYTRIDDEGGQA